MASVSMPPLIRLLRCEQASPSDATARARMATGLRVTLRCGHSLPLRLLLTSVLPYDLLYFLRRFRRLPDSDFTWNADTNCFWRPQTPVNSVF